MAWPEQEPRKQMMIMAAGAASINTANSNIKQLT